LLDQANQNPSLKIDTRKEMEAISKNSVSPSENASNSPVPQRDERGRRKIILDIINTKELNDEEKANLRTF
jgi:hypothetical protein